MVNKVFEKTSCDSVKYRHRWRTASHVSGSESYGLSRARENAYQTIHSILTLHTTLFNLYQTCFNFPLFQANILYFLQLVKEVIDLKLLFDGTWKVYCYKM